MLLHGQCSHSVSSVDEDGSQFYFAVTDGGEEDVSPEEVFFVLAFVFPVVTINNEIFSHHCGQTSTLPVDETFHSICDVGKRTTLSEGFVVIPGTIASAVEQTMSRDSSNSISIDRIASSSSSRCPGRCPIEDRHRFHSRNRRKRE